jgi:hypothetical protein
MYSDLIIFAVSDTIYDFPLHDLALGFCPPREAGEVASEARRRGLAQRLFVYAPQTPPSLVALLDHKSSTFGLGSLLTPPNCLLAHKTAPRGLFALTTGEDFLRCTRIS